LNRAEATSISPTERGFEVIKSRANELIIAAGIAHIVYSSREAVLITLFVDDYGVKLVVKAASLAGGDRHIRIFTRKTRSIQNRPIYHPHVSVEVDIVSMPLHAKLYMPR